MCWGFIKATYMKMNYKMSMGIKMHVISFFSSEMCDVVTNNIWFFCIFDEKKQDIDHTYQVRLCDNFSSFLKYLVIWTDSSSEQLEKWAWQVNWGLHHTLVSKD